MLFNWRELPASNPLGKLAVPRPENCQSFRKKKKTKNTTLKKLSLAPEVLQPDALMSRKGNVATLAWSDAAWDHHGSLVATLHLDPSGLHPA